MERDVILNRLLDKYENSSHLTHPGTSNRRVMLRVDKGELPEYRYESADVRDAYNAAAEALAREGLVTLKWVTGRPVISEFVLVLDRVDHAYRLVGRLHPKQKTAAFCAQVRTALAGVTIPWIKAWGQAACERAEESFRLPLFCPSGSGDFLTNLLRVFVCYDALHGEAVSMRAFSTRCFQDSKKFEREFRDEFLRLARQYNDEIRQAHEQSDVGAREELALLGIYVRPELYELCGECRIETDTGTLDLHAVPFGLAFPSTGVSCIRRFELSQIERVTFIENKTSYDEYLQMEKRAGELVIYHGGFLSPQKRLFIQKLAQSLDGKTKVYFWADIDLGGFRMFDRLQSMIPSVSPMRMSADEIRKYAPYGLARSDEYLQTLQQAFETHAFPLFSSAIEEILRFHVTIEQEAFLLKTDSVVCHSSK